MSRSRLILLLLLVLPRPSAAGSFELAAYAGLAWPTYDKTFTYDPGIAFSGIPGVDISQSGKFTLQGDSGLAFGGGATFYFAGILGLEGRLDSADVNIVVSNPVFHVTADLPSPLPDLSQDITLTPGTVDLERLRPLSLNLKLRTPGPVRFTFSAGGSYLPDFKLAVTQRLALGVTGVTPTDISLGSLTYRAQAAPSGEGQGRWGLNAGAGLQLALGDKVALVVEGRAFVFQKQTITWSRADSRPLTPLEEALARELDQRLDAIEFNPTFIQATAGIAITF
jgi:opacity protein-like surface antigen